eukprot:3972370-Pleurochrysis_carterae.AAC.1
MTDTNASLPSEATEESAAQEPVPDTMVPKEDAAEGLKHALSSYSGDMLSLSQRESALSAERNALLTGMQDELKRIVSAWHAERAERNRVHVELESKVEELKRRLEVALADLAA